MLNIGLGLVDSVVEIAIRAGKEILKVYNTDFKVEIKDDQSPVTEADQIAETLILRSIKEGISDKFRIISEESAIPTMASELLGTPFWLVDPLDGTKEFINRNGEFTVNIALIQNSKPVLGVVHIPDKNTTFWGSPHGAFVQRGEKPPKPISCRQIANERITAVVSRSHPSKELDTFLSKLSVTKKLKAGSSLKFCLIAEGSADLYPRMGRTMEWDTAAGHAILNFAGGVVKTSNGMDLSYAKANFENPNFLASGTRLEELEKQFP